jgi:hypothetical protein
VKGFRGTYQIPEEKHVHLVFDGERLDQDMTVGETDLTDLDTIDVHVK